ncbi:hypothetical protein J6590_004427 [Homalodisca vitripennis]|nr:hypothetical protein J6590_004427 [Homalodisca vitripennis]
MLLDDLGRDLRSGKYRSEVPLAISAGLGDKILRDSTQIQAQTMNARNEWPTSSRHRFLLGGRKQEPIVILTCNIHTVQIVTGQSHLHKSDGRFRGKRNHLVHCGGGSIARNRHDFRRA